jgi:transposase-like protein
MTISKEMLDELLTGVERPEDLLGDTGLMKELKIKLMERMLGAALTAHLGYEEGKEAPPAQSNRRNGASTKVLKGQDGEMPVAVPRDRDSSFEPELVKKGQTRIDGMDDKIIHCPAGDCAAICREGPLRRRADGAGHSGHRDRADAPGCRGPSARRRGAR